MVRVAAHICGVAHHLPCRQSRRGATLWIELTPQASKDPGRDGDQQLCIAHQREPGWPGSAEKRVIKLFLPAHGACHLYRDLA